MDKNNINDQPKLPAVLVTGANGYIGSMLVKTLLERGYKVRGTVRKLHQPELRALPNADALLDLVYLDLDEPYESFVKVLEEGVEWIFHVAASVAYARHASRKQEKACIDTAVNGTLSLLKAAKQVGTVKKFVLTSSVNAIAAGHDFASRTNKPFNEDDWAQLDGKHILVYDKCKTMAEKAAWEFIQENKDIFALSVVNPGCVIGPAAISIVSSLSLELYTRPLNATDPGALNIFFQLVDIRDVVEAHIQAAKIEKAAGKRFIVVHSSLGEEKGGELFFPEMIKILEEEFEPMGYKVPSNQIPKWIVWLLSFVDADIASFYPVLGLKVHFDNSQSKDVLGLTYPRTIKETILEGAHSLIQLGIIPKKKGYKKPE